MELDLVTRGIRLIRRVLFGISCGVKNLIAASSEVNRKVLLFTGKMVSNRIKVVRQQAAQHFSWVVRVRDVWVFFERFDAM